MLAAPRQYRHCYRRPYRCPLATNRDHKLHPPTAPPTADRDR